jgi:hypothetical protein
LLVTFQAIRNIYNSALVVGTGVLAQGAARIAPRILQTNLLSIALLLYMAKRRLLMGCGGANTEWGGVFGLLRVVLGGWR